MKAMNSSWCLDTCLKLVLGETLWHNGPQGFVSSYKTILIQFKAHGNLSTGCARLWLLALWPFVTSHGVAAAVTHAVYFTYRMWMPYSLSCTSRGRSPLPRRQPGTSGAGVPVGAARQRAPSRGHRNAAAAPGAAGPGGQNGPRAGEHRLSCCCGEGTPRALLVVSRRRNASKLKSNGYLKQFSTAGARAGCRQSSRTSLDLPPCTYQTCSLIVFLIQHLSLFKYTTWPLMYWVQTERSLT